MVSDGSFRADLYYRINVIEIQVPSLRERKEDFSILIDSFIKQTNEKYKLDIYGVADSVMPMLKEYHWPGNVRELQHLIERACILRRIGLLQSSDFSFPFSEQSAQQKFSGFKQRHEDAERAAIMEALERFKGNKTEAANFLNITRMTLYRKLQKYNIEG